MSNIDWAALTAPCTQLLGGPALYLPAAGGQTLIQGVFDEAFEDLRPDNAGGAAMNSVSPVIGIQPGDLPAPPLKGDRLRIKPGLAIAGDPATIIAVLMATGDLYTVKDVQPDSHGGAILMLNYTPSAGA